MKKKAPIILLTGALALSLLMTSCGGGSDGTGKNDTANAKVWVPDTVTADMVGPESGSDTMALAKDMHTGINKLAINKIYEELETCLSSTTDSCAKATTMEDCTGKYCDSPECVAKLMCCHSISKDKFDDMVAASGKRHATFPEAKVHAVVDSTKCMDEYVMMSTNATGRKYFLTRVKTTGVRGLGRRVFYSGALMKGIVAQKFDSILIYKGIDLDNGHKIMPFVVYSGGNPIGYYDVSDTQP